MSSDLCKGGRRYLGGRGEIGTRGRGATATGASLRVEDLRTRVSSDLQREEEGGPRSSERVYSGSVGHAVDSVQ